MTKGHVLISGASFAGLAAAFWMRRAGYEVTVVEAAPAIREGGTPVNIKGRTVDIMRRMGLLEAMVANRVTTDTIEVWGTQGLVHRMGMTTAWQEGGGEAEYEVERDWLTRALFDLVKDDITVLFGESITALHDDGNRVEVDLRSGGRPSVDLVFGCDGIGSNVRRLAFGEQDHSHFLNSYGTVTIVPRLLVEPGVMSIYEEPGRSVLLSAHHGKTDIITLFSADERIDYGSWDRARRTALVTERMAHAGWRVPELLDEIERADNFYFCELAQIRMPAWSKGRVALVGDAAYCASPAAGMGGSLALDGAAALADAFAAAGGDHVDAFCRYDREFRPYLEAVQAEAAEHCERLVEGGLTASF